MLEFASSANHIEMVSWLLEKGAKSARWESRHDKSPLHVAATLGLREMVELFVDRGVYDVNAQAGEKRGGNTALHFTSELTEEGRKFLIAKYEHDMKGVKNPPPNSVLAYDPVGVVEVLLVKGGANASVQSE